MKRNAGCADGGAPRIQATPKDDKTMKKIAILCLCLVSVGFGGTLTTAQRPQDDSSIRIFWKKFRTAVIKKDKATVAELSQFPIAMPYGYRSVRNKAQLIRRYRDVFNHEGDAAECFNSAQPESDAARPKEFTVACKNAAGDEVVIYSFVRTRNGWRFNSLDNLNE